MACARNRTPVWPLLKRARGSSRSVPETGGRDDDRIDARRGGHHCRVDNQVVERGVSGIASVQVADVSGASRSRSRPATGASLRAA